MGSKSVRLTDFSLRALPLPPRGQKTYWDDTLPGFGCRVSQGGTRSFVVQHGADRQLVTIGRYRPDVLPLAQARIEAKRILAERVLGKHRPRSVSFDDAKQNFLAACARKNKPRTVYDYTRLLNRHFKFGRMQLADISPADVQHKVDRIQAPAERRYATVLIKAFFSWAYKRSYIDRSPADRLDVAATMSRARVLTDDELKAIWIATEQCGSFGAIVKLLILTGQRRGEIAALRREFFQDDVCTLPRTLTKNGREHVFPIGPLAVTVLAAAPAEGLLFPARGRNTPFNGWSKAKRQLDKLSGVSSWTLHDLRRTFSTRLAQSGVAPHIIERLLNHVSGTISGVAAVYNRHHFLPEMRVAIENWESRLTAILASGGGAPDEQSGTVRDY